MLNSEATVREVMNSFDKFIVDRDILKDLDHHAVTRQGDRILTENKVPSHVHECKPVSDKQLDAYFHECIQNNQSCCLIAVHNTSCLGIKITKEKFVADDFKLWIINRLSADKDTCPKNLLLPVNSAISIIVIFPVNF